ncbi:MAG: hypothetical protein JW840_06245 [Candidatus Thermoplasmatota archaeon]|nr:hypothetical protein [Candidatus Thermoplasmatota archaeon]
MAHTKIKVGHYYTLTGNNQQTIACAVLYGFERGKNKDVYTLRMYTKTKDFEFPIEESTFDRWVDENRIKEITAEEAMFYAM